jgi:outer membrane protein TolC
MKHLLLLILLPFSLTAELTLEQAWTIALENSPTEQIAQARLSRAEAQAAQARSAYHPLLSSSASGSRIEYSGADLSFLPGDAGSTPDAVEQYEVELSAAWVLWNGGRRKYGVQAGEFTVEAFTAGLADARERLLAEVGQAFTAAQLSRANLRIAEADVEFQERQLQNSIRKEQAGLDSRTDRLNFEIRKLSAESVATGQRAQFESSMATLSALLGVDPEEPVAPPVRLEPENSELPDSVPGGQEVWESLQTVLPALVEAERQVAAAEARVRALEGEFAPELSAFGNLSAGRQDDPSFEEDDLGNTIGIQLQWDLWTGDRRSQQVREAEATLAEARASARQARLQAVAEVKRTVAVYTASVESESLSARTYELSRENRDLVEAAYEAGRETLLRLNEAQRDFNNAGVRYAAARLERQLAWIDYQRATGMLRQKAAPVTP